MDAHPTEVVTLVLTNGDALDASKYWVPSFTASGIMPYVYTPAGGSTARGAWPTLGSMISSGKRLVVFMDYPTNAGGVPWIISEFDNVGGSLNLGRINDGLNSCNCSDVGDAFQPNRCELPLQGRSSEREPQRQG